VPLHAVRAVAWCSVAAEPGSVVTPGSEGSMTGLSRIAGFTPRGAECLCSGCGRAFTSLTAFDRHQTLRDGLTCRDPASCGLIARRERDGATLWGFPAADASWWDDDVSKGAGDGRAA